MFDSYMLESLADDFSAILKWVIFIHPFDALWTDLLGCWLDRDFEDGKFRLWQILDSCNWFILNLISIIFSDFIACPNRACYYKLRVCLCVCVYLFLTPGELGFKF